MDDDDRLRARVEVELRDQGSSIAITDATVITRIAPLLAAEGAPERERCLAAIKRRLAAMESAGGLASTTPIGDRHQSH
jgi:hypothetical protein